MKKRPSQNKISRYSCFRSWVFLLTISSILLTGKASFADPFKMDNQYQLAKSLEEFEIIAGKIQKILKKNPDQPEWEWRLARSHYSLAKRVVSKELKIHHYDQCIKHNSQALELKPDSAIGYFFRALCRGKKGEMQGIWASLEIIRPFEEDMKQALKLDPSVQYGGPPRALGNLYLELPFFLGGNLDQSVYYLEEAVRLAPDYAENHLGLAKAYQAQNNLSAAQKSLLTLMRLTDKIADDEELLNLRKEGQHLMRKMAP